MTWMLRFMRRLAIAALALAAWAFAPTTGAWGASTPPVPVSLPYFAGIGASPLANTIHFYDANTAGDIATLPSGGWPSPYSSAQPQAMAIAADGTIWISGSYGVPFFANIAFDPTTGAASVLHSYAYAPTASPTVLTPPPSNTAPLSYDFAIGPDGGLYYCATGGNVYRLDPTTGHATQAIASASLNGGCQGGVIQFEPDGFLYVGDVTSKVDRFTIAVTTGSSPSVSAVQDSVVISSTALSGPGGIAEGPDGDVYISGASSNNVVRFDGTTGADKGVVIDASTSIYDPYKLGSPGALAFGPDGDLYVDSGGAMTGSLPYPVYPGIVQVNTTTKAATPFTTEHIVSLIFQDHPPAYSVPQTGSGGTRLCPSPDMSAAVGISPPGTGAYGQTLAEVNPFDPIHQTAPCDPGGVPSSSGGTTYLPWTGSTPALAPWVPTRKPWQQYNLFRYVSAARSDYTPYNGRWVTLYTQIPADYSVPSANPNGPWWYLRYQTNSADGSITDRTTIELQVLDSPPRLIN